MSFTDDEISYLRSQPLARLATVSADGQPTPCPSVWSTTAPTCTSAGATPARTRKYLNVRGRQREGLRRDR